MIGPVLEYANVLFSVVGSVYIARRDRRGYVIFIAGFPMAAAFAAYYRHWWLLLLYVYYFLVNCYGFYKWRKHDADSDSK